ncbi:MAG: pilus assembly protein N-terminal domain-containing protein [Pseudomonadota bacterium]
MKRSCGIALLLCCVFPIAGIAGAAEALPSRVELFVGDSQVISADVTRAAIGTGRIVSVSTPERGQILLLGEAPGTTTLQLWLRGGERKRVRVVVSELDLASRLEQVNKLLEGTQHISARIAGNRIVLEGQRVNDADQLRATAITESYPGLILNFIGTPGWETMIQMDVKIIEVRRDHVDALGIRWDTSIQGPSAGLALGEPVLASPLPPGIKPPGAFVSLATQLTSRIDLLQRQGFAETIAQPTLSCRSGGVARFVAGGEIPIPVTDGLGSTDVQYKEYGVILELRPRADSSGAIYAEIEAELSQVDDSIRVQGFPGFLKRRSSTAVNVRAGDTVVIAGLLSLERGRDRQAVPGLSRVPLAGGLFSSRQKRSRQTELLVIITPRTLSESVAGPPDASADQRERIDASRKSIIDRGAGATGTGAH